jgi:hypothetical protein
MIAERTDRDKGLTLNELNKISEIQTLIGNLSENDLNDLVSKNLIRKKEVNKVFFYH